MRIPHPGMLLLAVLGLSLAALAAALLAPTIAPPPLEWHTLTRPVVTASTLTVVAEADRRGTDCTSGPQIDIHDGDREIRLPVPTRVIDGRLSTYQTVLATPLRPGSYRVRLREIVTCKGDRHDVPSPWIAFTVPAVPQV